ncbi:hypothetical protein KW783_03860 [Candidatus Parcubacteria bacterium]|nr:hypothetical protein [Candidatus Parcubacteria bacterium]
MSLIFGINLSDRIYVSADTRLTQKNGDTVIGIKDKIIKITPFSDDIAAAFAGNAKMSQFLSQKLTEVIKPEMNIRSLRGDIQKFLSPIIDQYWKEMDPSSAIAIIFGGLNRTEKKKPISGKKIYDLALAHSKTVSASFNLKPTLFNSIFRESGQPLRYPETSDSHVFSVQIFPPNGFEVEDAEWGQYLAYGAGGITKNTLDPTIMSRIEFAGSAGQDNAIITAILGEVVQRTKEPTISSTFFTHVISDDVSGAITGQIVRVDVNTMQSEIISDLIIKDGKIYSKLSTGALEQLTMLHHYKDFADLKL